MVTPRPAWLTRRRFLLGAGTAVGVGAAAGAGVGIDRALGAAAPPAGRARRARRGARRAAGRPARPPARVDRVPRHRPAGQLDPAAVRPAALLRRRRHPHAGLRPAARGGAAHARADLPVDAVRAAVHRRLGAVLLHRRAPRRTANPIGHGALGLRAARDRRLPPLPAHRLRRRDAAGRRSRPRSPAARPSRTTPTRPRRSTSRPRCGGGRRGPGSSAPACPPSGRTPAASPAASPSRATRRCSWGSNRP